MGFKLKCLGFLPALVVLLPSGDAGQGEARCWGVGGWEGEGVGESATALGRCGPGGAAALGLGSWEGDDNHEDDEDDDHNDG